MSGRGQLGGSLLSVPNSGTLKGLPPSCPQEEGNYL